MGENAELQEEELEVLKSIYEGDSNYTSQSNTRHQYKYGEDGKSKSFILEISWPDSYPGTLPDISLESFYNKHLVPDVSQHIKKSVLDEADQYLGMSMTYSLFEFVKENFDTLIESQPESIEAVTERIEKVDIKGDEPDDDTQADSDKTKVKKSQMTKAQKRRMWDKGGAEEDRSRGWDWVDVVKHLHQTGGKEE
eukprot:TRINITY_DN5034_c0_g1_i2.p1 TRINITY_DN5034_c0_g1~~TRINITY_DN5034_c0_g1_i2.p1  ORF type:complete len:195 (-),score=55.25 TRINITY_DN5034_c0_g1_i2:262-846(-)